jgi:hypothetical protein
VNPLYYVTFTTCTLIASFLLFRGFNTTSAVNTISLLCGFLIIFSGVYLLNLSRDDPEGNGIHGNSFTDAPPSDAISGFPTRYSMQSRRSMDSGFRSPFLPGGGNRSRNGSRHDLSESRAMMHDYDVENQFELGDLVEDSDEAESGGGAGRKRTSFDASTDETVANHNGITPPRSVRMKKESVLPSAKSLDR